MKIHIEEFALFFEHTQKLQFEQKPDYVWLRKLFRDLFFKLEKDWSFDWDWINLVIPNI